MYHNYQNLAAISCCPVPILPLPVLYLEGTEVVPQLVKPLQFGILTSNIKPSIQVLPLLLIRFPNNALGRQQMID